jgi:hypothetical protein
VAAAATGAGTASLANRVDAARTVSDGAVELITRHGQADADVHGNLSTIR